MLPTWALYCPWQILLSKFDMQNGNLNAKFEEQSDKIKNNFDDKFNEIRNEIKQQNFKFSKQVNEINTNFNNIKEQVINLSLIHICSCAAVVTCCLKCC